MHTERGKIFLIIAINPYLASICHYSWIPKLLYTLQKKKVDTFSTLIISYTNSINGKCYISYERKIYLLSELLQVMTLKFMHDWTHSVNKDKVTNQKLHKHNWKTFQWLFNEDFSKKTKLWNSLDQLLKEACSLNSFKYHLKMLFTDKY